MPVTEKVLAVTECCTGGLGIFASATRLRAISVLSNPASTAMQKFHASQLLKFSGTDVSAISEISRAGGQTIDETIISTGRFTATEISAIGGEAVTISRWTKAFRVAIIALRVLNIMLLGLTSVIVGFEIASDFKMHVSPALIAFDILGEICMCLSVIFEVVSLVLDLLSVVCASIPIIGTVLILVGLVACVISMIIRSLQTPPATTVEHFVSEVIVVFVNKLKSPSAKWIEENKLKLA